MSTSSPRSARANSPNTVPFQCKNGVLPGDVLNEILRRLPLKSLCRARCVSKEWSQNIQDIFGRSRRGVLVVQSKPENPHAPHKLCLTSIDCHTGVCKSFWKSCEERVKVVRNSVHGLILYLLENSNHHLDLCLCNPATEEGPLILPRDAQCNQCMGGSGSHSAAFDMGYDERKNEYKVLLFGSFPVCYIFTVGTNSWRKITSKPLHGCKGPRGSSVSIDGKLFWCDADLYNNKMISFDVSEERFASINGPPGEGRLFTLFELDCSLCAYDTIFSQQTMNFSILRGNKWSKMAVIKIPCTSVFYMLPQRVQEGEIIIAQASGASGTVFFYSFITGSVSSLSIEGLKNGFIPINYEKNLSKLKALGF